MYQKIIDIERFGVVKGSDRFYIKRGLPLEGASVVQLTGRADPRRAYNRPCHD